MKAHHECTERLDGATCGLPANVYLHEMVTVAGETEWLAIRPVCPIHATHHLLASVSSPGMAVVLTTIPQPLQAD